MPLVAGVFGLSAKETGRLRRDLDKTWPCKWHQCPEGIIGAHTFREATTVLTVEQKYVVAIDGTTEALDNFGQHFRGDWQSLPDAVGAFVSDHCVSVIGMELSTGEVCVACDPSGAIPLYYRHYQGGFVAASMMRPMKGLGNRIDIVGAFEFLRLGYTLGGRSVIQEIQRLLPGQFVRVHLQRGESVVEERSKLWAGEELGDGIGTESIVNEGWERLTSAVWTGASGRGLGSLMMSGGWDSRTLLAASMGRGHFSDLKLYVHGDAGSRELALVGGLADIAGAELHVEPIEAEIFDPSALQSAFSLLENVIFPQWIHAGRVLGELGIDSVEAGVFGEVLGGHYGVEMLLPGPAKAVSVLGRLTGTKRGRTPLTDDKLRLCHDLLSVRRFGKAWYLRKEFWQSVGAVWEQIDRDIEAALIRLRNRGVDTFERAIEAFISEHRGVQYINQQLLSCRVGVDVHMPYCKPSFLAWSAMLPAGVKIHNRLNRAIIDEYQPELLSLPLASTFFKARAPIVYQEFGRLLRSVLGRLKWRRYVRSRGRRHPPRFGWMNYEFLRRDRVLEAVVEDLRLDWWDAPAMFALLENARDYKWKGGMHPVADQLMKVYTVDLMLR